MRKYVLLLLVLCLLVAGWWVGQNTDRLKVLYRKHFSDEFFINPLVELDPAETYTVTLWVYRLPSSHNSDLEIQLESSLQEFRRLHPNIEVSYKLLGVLEGEQLLQQALAEGNPPDLYCSFFEPFSFFSSLQIPVDLYLEDSRSYYSVALSNFRFGEHLWAWPLSIVPEFYVSNDTQVNQQLNWAQIAGANEGSAPFAADSSPEGVYVRYCSPFGLAALNNEYEERWLADITHIGQGYRNGTIIHAPADGLRRFLQQDVSIVGPLTPWSHRLVRERAQSQISTHFLSPFRANSAGLIMFRQADYKGHRHTKAAALLARYLVEQQPQALIPLDLFCCPAYRPLGENWLQNAELTEAEGASYRDLLRRGQPVRVYSAEQWEQYQQFVERIVLPLWGQFINGQFAAEELLHQLQQEARDFIER